MTGSSAPNKLWSGWHPRASRTRRLALPTSPPVDIAFRDLRPAAELKARQNAAHRSPPQNSAPQPQPSDRPETARLRSAPAKRRCALRAFADHVTAADCTRAWARIVGSGNWPASHEVRVMSRSGLFSRRRRHQPEPLTEDARLVTGSGTNIRRDQGIAELYVAESRQSGVDVVINRRGEMWIPDAEAHFRGSSDSPRIVYPKGATLKIQRRRSQHGEMLDFIVGARRFAGAYASDGPGTAAVMLAALR